MIVLKRLEQRVRETVPRELLPDLRQHVVGHKAHEGDQGIQHIPECRLEEKESRGIRDNLLTTGGLQIYYIYFPFDNGKQRN